MKLFRSITCRAVLVGTVGSLLQLQTATFSQDIHQSDAAAAVAKPDSRPECPPEAKVEEAVQLIRAAYEAAYNKAKDTGEPEQLIEQLTSLASKAKDSAQRYALLLEAEAIATQYENYATAVDLLAKRAEQFQIDGLRLKGQLLKRLAGTRVAADPILFDQASDTAEQAMQAERFDVAAESASLAVSVAKAIDREQKAEARKRGRLLNKIKQNEADAAPIGTVLVKKATALHSQVIATQKLFAEYGEGLTQIKARPDDAAANTAVAKYLCFVRGEWQKGLPALAKSDLNNLSEVAAKETALLAERKPDPKRVFELAGAWWSASELKGLTDEEESAIKDHAAGFYADVLESLSDDLEKQLAKSRLRGLSSKRNKPARPPIFLSDMPVKRSLVGWDRLRMGRIPDLRVNGDAYDKVIKADASSLVVFDLPTGFEGTLQGKVAIAGLSKEISPPSSCRFRIRGDETMLWESGFINQDKTTGLSVIEAFNVNLSGSKTITLEVDSLGPNNSDWSVWVDPVLLWQGTTLSNVSRPTLVVLDQPPLVNSIGMKLKLIPAGIFRMGSNENESDEKPVHEVKITKPFYMGVYEVTNAQWKAVMRGEAPSKWKDDNRPVEQVNWDDALEFCRRLSSLPDEKTAGRVYRLPTEAEWEYACRAGTTTRFSFGDNAAALGDHGWFANNSGRGSLDAYEIRAHSRQTYDKQLKDNECQTHQVGGKKPNPWGLYDLHGNVSELCSDWFGVYTADAVADPAGPARGSYRIVRGGAWGDTYGACTSANRIRHRGGNPKEGFRIVLGLPETTATETLTVEQARALAAQQGQVDLSGLTTLSPEAARELAKHKAGLVLGLTTLPADVAQALGGHTGTLYLDRISEISVEVAQALAKQPGHLALNGLTTLTPEVARELAKHKSQLLLNGLTMLSTEVAQAFSSQEGGLYLTGLKTLSPEAARELAKHNSGLHLGLTVLSPEVAEAFAEHEGTLYFDQVSEISKEVAQALAKQPGHLVLNGVTTLTPEVARELAKHRSFLSLAGLTSVSDEALVLLRENQNVKLSIK